MGRRDHCYFFGTNHLDVLTASNDNVKPIVLTFRENKQTRPRLLYWQILSLVCPLKYHVTLLLSRPS